MAATLTKVANSNLCPGVTKSTAQIYLDLVEKFAAHYKDGPGLMKIAAGESKWEGGAAVDSNRLDMQGTAKGSANIQAQFGSGHKNCSEGGSWGGVLMLCDTVFAVEDFRAALKMSLDTKGTHLVQMTLASEAASSAAPADKRMKTKPGKKPWTPDTTY